MKKQHHGATERCVWEFKEEMKKESGERREEQAEGRRRKEGERKQTNLCSGFTFSSKPVMKAYTDKLKPKDA